MSELSLFLLLRVSLVEFSVAREGVIAIQDVFLFYCIRVWYGGLLFVCNSVLKGMNRVSCLHGLFLEFTMWWPISGDGDDFTK